MKRILALVWTITLAGGLCVVLPTVASPPASALVACDKFFYTAAPSAIPDLGSTRSGIDTSEVTDSDPIVDLDVAVGIDHSFDGDLEVTLSSRGVTVPLVLRRGGSGDDFDGTVFDDGASQRIRDVAAPFTGRFRPEQSLNAFDGMPIGGDWTLTINDRSAGDTGTLGFWSLTFRTQWCDDRDRDGIKDSYDSCPDVKGVVPQGCPARARAVSIAYNRSAKEFRGVLRCAIAPRCADTQPLRIYKVAAGTDPLVARLASNEDGSYALRKAGVSGTYYVVAPAVFEDGVAECGRAQSPNLTV